MNNRQLMTRLVLALGVALLLAGCERPPPEIKQIGYRGTAMELVGPRAKDVYQNVKVLGDLSVGQFTRLMVAMTAWVAPNEGCNYCHNPQNLADDSKYTKVVARRMVEMNQHINADWQSHVGATGVTCYTCHRGQPVPNQVWFKQPDRANATSLLGDLAGQNAPSPTVAWSSLPNDVLNDYLKDAKPIRVNGKEALARFGSAGNNTSTKQAEHTYGLMMHMSQSLGVNCTFCHNTQSFQSWEISPPQRATAWHGIRMARDLNTEYLVPLTGTFPGNRKGPTGDVAKVGCGTCHQGANKPLNGARMAQHHPELLGPIAAASAAAAPAAAAPAATGGTPAAAAAPAAAPTGLVPAGDASATPGTAAGTAAGASK